MPSPDRRDVLRRISTAAVPLVAGCSSETPDPTTTDSTPASGPGTSVSLESLAGQVKPDGEPSARPDPLTCDQDGFVRAKPLWEGAPVRSGTISENGAPTFALRVSETTVSRGDTVEVSLTNVRSSTRTTGVQDEINIDVLTTGGWQDVRGYQGTPMPYPSKLVEHEPATGFTWTLTLSGNAVVEDHIHDSALTVCPGLPVGRYRFVYRGTDDPVGVAFDLIE